MLNRCYHLGGCCALRTLARRVGILYLLKKLPFAGQKEYEKRFRLALEQAVKPGDVIWDIGANVGHYTSQFLGWSAPDGFVVAFEPFPPTFETLKRETAKNAGNQRVSLQRVALSNWRGQAKFLVDKDNAGDFVSTTAHLTENSGGGGHCVEVEVNTVDGIREENHFPIPNIVKIDVEGFEEEVLKGGEATFSHPSCRSLFVEVHFGRIAERGVGRAVPRIVKMLRGWGYRAQWVDPSHLCANK